MRTLKDFHEWFLKENNEFSLAFLRRTSELNKIISYCYQLGEPEFGMGRMVWKINAQYVIKVAQTEDAALQNKKEVESARCLGKRFAVEVFDYDKVNFFWIIEERVKPFDDFDVKSFVKEMNRILGTQYTRSHEIRALFNPQPINKSIDPEVLRNEWFQDFMKALNQCDVDRTDLGNSNWGIRSSGELVILDLGL